MTSSCFNQELGLVGGLDTRGGGAPDVEEADDVVRCYQLCRSTSESGELDSGMGYGKHAENDEGEIARTRVNVCVVVADDAALRWRDDCAVGSEVYMYIRV